MAANLKETLHTLADELPEKVRFRRAVEIGIRAADRGEYATQEEIRAAFARWGVHTEDLSHEA